MLGASFDTPAENLEFATAQGFGYPLLSDVDQLVGVAYDVLRPAGHRYASYPRRLSYLIDPHGFIQRAYEVTDVEGHADAVLQDLAELNR